MKKNVFFVVSFFLVLAMLAAMTLFLPARKLSENENRELAQMPVFNADTVLSGEFQNGLADFLSDQIPGRERWIALNTSLKKLLGQKKINGVYLGDDGYYFQAFTDSDYSESRKDAGFELFNEFAQETGTSVKILMVPTPGAVMADKLPVNAPMYNADKLWSDLITAASDCEVIDLRQVFAANAKDSQLYYRTDHHWTTQGAYLAYAAYCEAMGVEAKPLTYFGLEQVSDSFYGTIYSKVLDSAAKPDSVYAATNLPEVTVTIDDKTVMDSVYVAESLNQKDKYEYFFGGNYGKVEITTEANNGKTLVIIKDSFANSLVPYMLEDYERIIMLDMRYFGGKTRDVIAQNGVTDVLIVYEMTNLLTGIGDFSKLLK